MMDVAVAPASNEQEPSPFGEMLLELDERVRAIELTWEYAARLTAAEWLELGEVAGRNEIAPRIA